MLGDEIVTGAADRALVAAPTRSGKTVIAGRVAELVVARGKRFAFACWSRTIMLQTQARFLEWGLDCSLFAAGHDYDPAAPIAICMVQTMDSRKRLQPLPVADYWAFDEAHNDYYHKIIRSLGAAPKIIGLSATPIDERGYGLGRKDKKGKGYDVLIPGASYAELRDAGALIPCEIFVPDGQAMFRQFAESARRLQSAGAALIREREVMGDPVAHWKRRAEGRPTVAFFDGVQVSKGWAAAFNRAGVPAAHVDADTKDGDEPGERGWLHEEHRQGRIKVLCNDSIYTTGWDAPWVSCVLVFRKMGSLRLWRQASARAMGSFDGDDFNPPKSRCVILDHAGCALAFGPPDMDIPWALDPRTNVTELAVEQRVERIKAGEIEPTVCAKCGAWRENRGPQCPRCGYIAERRATGDFWLPGVLKKLDEAIEATDSAGPQRLYTSLIHQAIRRGLAMKQVDAIFRAKTGKWPNECNIHNCPQRDDWNAKNMLAADWARRFTEAMHRRDEAKSEAARAILARPTEREQRLAQFDIPPEIRARGPDAVDWYLKQQAQAIPREAYPNREQTLFEDTTR